ncbi:MAG: MgtC/SapB family protein [Verrucomicrobia bacterium]|nr:MgtC/SapB family protein [Verrucomicrobiota bacterium]
MNEILTPVIVSACLGALIGMIRQWGDQHGADPVEFAGLRTHTFWAILGCLGAYTSKHHVPYTLLGVFLAVTAHLVAQTANPHDRSQPGSTSFAGALLTILCGALVFWGETRAAILVAALTMVVHGSKQPIHSWARALTAADIRATLQFAAISGVILPLVPDRPLGPFQAFNPFSTWLMVVLISGMGFAGYVAIRLVGARAGILLTGLFGGLASSTASTLAFSRRSRDEPDLAEHYTLAVVAACTMMLPRVLVAIGLINREFSGSLLLPFAILALPGVAYVTWVWIRRRPASRPGDTPELGNPLGLLTAVKFAALYALIAFLVRWFREQGWTDGLLPLSFVSGLTDLDAIALSVSRDHADGGVTLRVATQAVVVAAVANTLLKAGLAIALGSAGLRRRIAAVLGLTALGGAAWLLLG